jgi:hypothetical protein
MIAPRNEVAHLTSRISLYYFWHTRFGGQGAQWQEKFHNQYIEMKARNFMPPKYRKERMKRIAAGEISEATVVYVQNWMHEGDGYDPSLAY